MPHDQIPYTQDTTPLAGLVHRDEGDELPESLTAYHEELLTRFGIDDAHQVLTSLVVTLAVSPEPLDEDSLRALSLHRNLIASDQHGQERINQALAVAGAVLKRTPTPEGNLGFVLYHDSFRAHILRSELTDQAVKSTREALRRAAEDWSNSVLEPLQGYLFRHGVALLLAAGHPQAAESLLIDLVFVEGMCRTAGAATLALAYEQTAIALSGESKRRLRLLGEAVRLDRQFLSVHPECLFQQMWNRCWWYDSPEAADHYQEPEEGWREPPPWKNPILFPLMEQWREYRQREEEVIWLRSLRPPEHHLDTALVAVFRGHMREIKSMAFSPDGRLLASASSDWTVRLWLVETGQELQVLRGHDDTVMCVAFSPDGRFLLSGSSDRTVRLWEVETGRELRALNTRSSMVESMTFSPDSSFVALVSLSRKAVLLWEVETGRRLPSLKTLAMSLAFSPDGRFLASGSRDSTVRLWEVETGYELGVLHGHESRVESIAFSSDGRFLASGSFDTVRLWLVETRQELWVLRGHDERVTSLAFSPDDRFLVSASYDNTVRLWSVETGQELRVLHGHKVWVESVAFSPNGHFLASGSADLTVRLWEVEKGRELKRQHGHKDWIMFVDFRSDGRLLTWDSKNEIRLWEPETARELRILRGHKSSVDSVASSPDGRFLAFSSGSETPWLWEVETGQKREFQPLHEHEDRLWTWNKCLAFSPDGRLLASASSNTVRLWEVETGQELQVPSRHKSLVESEAFSLVESVAFSPDGRFLASGHFEGMVRLLELETEECLEICVRPGHQITRVAFSPDGRFLASGYYGGAVWLWEVETKRELWLHGHEDKIESITFSPESRFLISDSRDNTARLWEVETGECVEVLNGMTAVPQPALFSPESHPWLPLARGSETVVLRRPGQREVAFLPLPLYHVRTSLANPRLVVGTSCDHLSFFFLEGTREPKFQGRATETAP